MEEKVTVEGLDALCQKIVEFEDAKDALEEQVSELNKEITQLVYRAAAFLKDLGREEYSTPIGKLIVETKMRVNLPQTDLDKQALFSHLRERGLFDKYATVNANSLNALYFADFNSLPPEDRMTFAMPGIGPVKVEEHPKFKRSRKARI